MQSFRGIWSNDVFDNGEIPSRPERFVLSVVWKQGKEVVYIKQLDYEHSIST